MAVAVCVGHPRWTAVSLSVESFFVDSTAGTFCLCSAPSYSTAKRSSQNLLYCSILNLSRAVKWYNPSCSAALQSVAVDKLETFSAEWGEKIKTKKNKRSKANMHTCTISQHLEQIFDAYVGFILIRCSQTHILVIPRFT